MKTIYFVVFLYCLLNYSYSINLPTLNNFKYSYIKTPSTKKKVGTNPVYLLLSAQDLVNKENNLDKGNKDIKEKLNENKNKNTTRDNNKSKHISSIDLISPKDLNIVENNNLDEVVNSLKRRVFTDQPTLVKLKSKVNLIEKNTNPENDVTSSILKLTELVTLSDRVVVPVDYHELVNKGCCGVKEIKLMGLVMFSSFIMLGKIPNVNFVIYNFKPISNSIFLSKYEKEYIERQKYEINEVITKFFKPFIFSYLSKENKDLLNISDINTSCEYVDKYSNINKILKDYYKQDAKFFNKCYDEIQKEFSNKLVLCENISKFDKNMGEFKQNRFNFSEFNQVIQNSDMYGDLFDVYHTSILSFYSGIKKLIDDKSEFELKPRVDKLVLESLNTYDNMVDKIIRGKVNEFKDKMVKMMKDRLIDDMRTYLYIYNKDVLSNVIMDLIKEHEQDISKITVTDTLDDTLSDLISKYDSKFVSEIKKCKYSIVDKYDLYESMTQEMRLKLVLSLKEFSNRIMEMMIRKGNYYHKFSILDGIRFIPNKRLINMVQKIFSKISVPVKIRISYLSPNAFGLSNLFRAKDAREGDTYVYITGKNKEK